MNYTEQRQTEIGGDIEIGKTGVEPTEFYRTPEYYAMLNDIRNMKVLTDHQMGYYTRLPKNQLIKILEVYNTILMNVNYLFS